MSGAPAEALALVALAVTLAWAVVRPRGLPEALAAVGAALLLLALGALPPAAAGDQVEALAPTLGFLAAVLVLGELCEREGLFAAAGALMARHARGRPRRLLALTFAVAAATTAVLSLDATVVLLTPAVFAAAAAARLRARPHVYACVHLANSASLLLPVSNLTNLLVFRASGISFAHFAALMALPWLVVLAVEGAVFTRFFRGELAAGARGGTDAATPVLAGERAHPRAAAAVLAGTLAGFGVSGPLGIDPAWIAAAGAAALAVPALAGGRIAPAQLVRASAPLFLLFVLALALVVRAAQQHGLTDAVDALVPGGSSPLTLLAVAALAATLANLVNNLPAVFVLLPALAGPGPLLAALIGLNVGPNLTYMGSLATLLWRRVLRARGAELQAGEFLRLGVLTVPLALLAGTLALWLSLRVIG